MYAATLTILSDAVINMSVSIMIRLTSVESKFNKYDTSLNLTEQMFFFTLMASANIEENLVVLELPAAASDLSVAKLKHYLSERISMLTLLAIAMSSTKLLSSF